MILADVFWSPGLSIHGLSGRFLLAAHVCVRKVLSFCILRSVLLFSELFQFLHLSVLRPGIRPDKRTAWHFQGRNSCPVLINDWTFTVGKEGLHVRSNGSKSMCFRMSGSFINCQALSDKSAGICKREKLPEFLRIPSCFWPEENLSTEYSSCTARASGKVSLDWACVAEYSMEHFVLNVASLKDKTCSRHRKDIV